MFFLVVVIILFFFQECNRQQKQSTSKRREPNAICTLFASCSFYSDYYYYYLSFISLCVIVAILFCFRLLLTSSLPFSIRIHIIETAYELKEFQWINSVGAVYKWLGILSRMQNIINQVKLNGMWCETN